MRSECGIHMHGVHGQKGGVCNAMVVVCMNVVRAGSVGCSRVSAHARQRCQVHFVDLGPGAP